MLNALLFASLLSPAAYGAECSLGVPTLHPAAAAEKQCPKVCSAVSALYDGFSTSEGFAYCECKGYCPDGSETDVASPAATNGAPAGFASEILAAHNRVRCEHGAPPLEWSPEVASYAQRWVDGLTRLKHSESYDSPLGPLGENMFATSGTPTGNDVVATWYGEASGYPYGEPANSNAGHFTAMIWKDARYLGCGVHGGIVACNYGSGTRQMDCTVPNMGGCYAEQVRPKVAGATCPG